MMNSRTLGLFGICLITSIVPSCSTDGDVLQPASMNSASGDTLAVDGEEAKDKHGSRLKVLYTRWTAEDGVRAVIPGNHFLDTKLSIECGFTQAEDGETRCLPLLKGYQVDSAKYYRDAACTQLVAAFMKCQPKPEYASESVPGPSPCGQYPFRVHKLGSAITPTALYDASGGCTPLSASALSTLLGTANIYPLTTIAPTEFVKGSWKYVQTP